LNDARFNSKESTALSSNGSSPDQVFSGVAEGEYAISITDVVRVLWRRMWAIVLVTIVVTGLVVGYDLQRPPIYEATSKILIGQQANPDAPVDTSVADLMQLTLTMAEAVRSRPVAQATIERLDLSMTPDDLLDNLSAEAIQDTRLIEVTYRDTDPAKAQQVVNAVGITFSERIATISPSTNYVSAIVWEKATIPDQDVSPNVRRDGVLALVLGGLLGIGLAFLLEFLDDRWRSPEEAEQISGVPTFGVIPEFKTSKGNYRGRG
jgi:capsular polysaccharide biosynthesis protein